MNDHARNERDGNELDVIATPEVELQAYVDGELSEPQAKLVASRIAASEIHARKYRVLKSVKEALDAAAPSADALDEILLTAGHWLSAAEPPGPSCSRPGPGSAHRAV